MPATSSLGRPGSAWPKWTVPLVVLVLLGAVAGGIAIRLRYGQPADAPAQPAPTPTRAQEQPGSSRVVLSEGAAEHPDHGAVRILLQTYFDSVNVTRYDRWKTTVVPAKQRQQPKDQWMENYRSTSDGSIRIHRITGGPDDSLRVLLSFTSVQDPSDAPSTMQVGCLRWRTVYRIVRYSGGLRLGVGHPGNALFRPC